MQITISPSPASAGTVATATGSGFDGNVELHVTEQNSASLFFFSAQTDEGGNVEFPVYADIPGSVDVKVYEKLHHGPKYSLVVETVLTVA